MPVLSGYANNSIISSSNDNGFKLICTTATKPKVQGKVVNAYPIFYDNDKVVSDRSQLVNHTSFVVSGQPLRPGRQKLQCSVKFDNIESRKTLPLFVDIVGMFEVFYFYYFE